MQSHLYCLHSLVGGCLLHFISACLWPVAGLLYEVLWDAILNFQVWNHHILQLKVFPLYMLFTVFIKCVFKLELYILRLSFSIIWKCLPKYRCRSTCTQVSESTTCCHVAWEVQCGDLAVSLSTGCLGNTHTKPAQIWCLMQNDDLWGAAQHWIFWVWANSWKESQGQLCNTFTFNTANSPIRMYVSGL